MDSSTSTRVTAVQSCPALKNAPSAISWAVRSMSTSAKTIAGALPPSSRWTSLSVFDAADMTCAPARVEPVMETISGISWSTMAAPVPRPPQMMFTTPAG